MKKLLVVVDYQHDFVVGSLGFVKSENIEKRIANKIRSYRDNGNEIVFTLDTHGEDYLKTYEGRHLPVNHCIKGTIGYDLYGEVKQEKKETDRAFSKNTYGSDALYEYLKETKFEAIEFVGVVTDICVISNVVLAKTAQPETEITVDALCVASNDDSLHEKALDVMESLQINVINRNGEKNDS